MSLTPVKSSLQFFFISCPTSIPTDPHQREKNNSIKTRKVISNILKTGKYANKRTVGAYSNTVEWSISDKPIVVMLQAVGLSFFISHRNLQNIR